MSLKSLKTAPFVATMMCVAMAMPSSGAKPYDAEITYLDANATSGQTSFFDTGLLPSDDFGALIRFLPKQAKNDSVLFGARAADETRWYFGGPSGGYYFGRSVGNTSQRPELTAGVVYDVRYNHFNERAYRVSGVDGSTITYAGAAVNEFYHPASTWTCSAELNPVHIFGHCVTTGTHTTDGNWYRIYFAQFTRGSAIVMDLIPVSKDGVGYMYDKVSGTLLAPQKLNDSVPDFALGSAVANESYIEGTIQLAADEDWTSRGNLRVESGAVIDLNGHTLTITGAFGDGTITDTSGTPGTLKIFEPAGTTAPLTVTTSSVTVLRSSTPYDAQVEYLESQVISSGVSHINLGLYPTNDMGAFVRFMPTQDTADSVLFGSKASTDKTWYFGGAKNYYLSWNSNPAAGTRPTLTKDSKYEVYLNYLNDRNRKIVGLDGATMTASGTTTSEFNLAIDAELNGGAAFTYPAYLFTFNNKGTPYNRYGSYRVYAATFTKGDKVVMDLVPVRKGGVGYMYDRVSNRFLGKASASLPDFLYASNVADTTWLTSSTELAEDQVCNVSADGGVVIDLKGHKLTVYALEGHGTITDTSTGEPGELHIVVPEGREVNVTLALTGNLKVVKEGAGRLVLARAGQTFTGGVVVAEGTAYAPQGLYAESNSYWGPSGGTITVMSGATFDNKGNKGYESKQFILAGGTLANSGDSMGSFDDRIFSRVKLTADSYFNAENTTHFWTQSGDSYVDLGGHKLTVSIGLEKTLYLNTVFSNGTFDVVSGGYLRPSPKSGIVVKHGSDTLDLRMTGGALNITADMPVRDYYAGYVKNYNAGTSKLLVHGTFTPAAVDDVGKEYFYGCTMQDGSCIDLSAKSSTWSTTSTGFTGGSRTVSFAGGATVIIDIHGRELAKGEQVVSWTTPPANLGTLTFTWDAATTALGKQIFVTDTGIYYDIEATDVAKAHWTGAAGDNDAANPLNWACTNFVGGGMTGVPMPCTDVRISGDVALQINAEHPLAYNSIYFDNVRLTADCDWGGLRDWVTANASASSTDIGSVDLNGHKLHFLSDTITDHIYDVINLAVTDSTSGNPGELHIRVPLSDSYLECDGFTLSGNVRLVTEGSGWFAMTKAGQTFTGGVVVAEGTAYSPYGNKYHEDGNFWGPTGGSVTILTNATFDARGNTNFYYKNFVLNGGVLADSSGMNTSCYGFGNVTLVADSILTKSHASSTMFAAPEGEGTVDLGEKTLTVSMIGSSHIYFHTPVVNGTMVFDSSDVLTSGGGYLNVAEGMSGGSPTVNIEMVKSAMRISGEFSVSNYVARYTGGYNSGGSSGVLKVYGTFSPIAQRSGKDAFFGPQMQDGSLIDLSAKTNAFSAVALGFSGTGNMQGNRTMTFADGATVGVLLGTRKVKSEEKIIDWSDAVPENRTGLTFYGELANGSRIKLKVMDDGVYMPRKGFILIVK